MAITVVRGPSTTVYANNFDQSPVAAGSAGLDISVTGFDMKDAKLAVWELSAVVNNDTLDTKISAANGARILNYAVGPATNLGTVPNASTMLASLALSTGIFTFTIAAGSRTFSLYVWYK